MSIKIASLLSAATAHLPAIVDVRRRLHRQPEIGLQLPATQATIAAELRELGIEPRLGRSVSSVVGVIDGGRPGPTVLLRADSDALPLTEETALPFASEVPGAMHACGHDTHVAMLLGGARLLLERRDELAGRVLLMFQPGEEGFHGARFMLEEGLLDAAGPEPDAAFAIHISTRYPSGTINLRPGALLAAADTLRFTITGRGGHASAPHRALDPIPVAAELVLALQTAVTRRIDVFDPAVLTIAQIAAGTTTNIIPETCFLAGTMRTVSDETRAQMLELVPRVARSVAEAHGAEIAVEIEPGYPVTFNDAGFVGFVREVAADVVGEAMVREMPAPIMGAEDFSYVLRRVPGAMVFLGARPPEADPETGPENHSNRVVFHEPAMAAGAALYAAVALRHLAG